MRIELKNACLSYGGKNVLDDFSLKLENDGLTVISGASGCGKTTLLRVIAGLEPLQSGIIEAPEKIGFLFQENRLFPWRTALEHISDVLPKEKRGEALQWLKLCELDNESASYPVQLSGGMARRLALARTLAFGGELYVLDEPFTGVDAEGIKRILKRIIELGVPVLLVSHDIDMKELADEMVLCEGLPLRVI